MITFLGIVNYSLPEFLSQFITQYAVELKTAVADEGQKKKSPNLEEIVISFFAAVCSITSKNLIVEGSKKIDIGDRIMIANAADIVASANRVALLAIHGPGGLFGPTHIPRRTPLSSGKRNHTP